MQVELKRIQQEVGITFIYVTHDQEEAMTMSDRIAVMNRGRFEQLGEPEELYERPRTRFVAGFLGISNLLRGQAAGTSDDFALVTVPSGASLRVPRAQVDGRSDVEVGVRPEKIRIQAAEGGASAQGNVLRGVVRDASYLGVSTQYIVDVGEERSVTVYEQNVDRTSRGSLFRAGDDVQLVWAPEHTFVVGKVPTADMSGSTTST
jgi:spermidine/putrescine transport system ATP-binding protein